MRVLAASKLGWVHPKQTAVGLGRHIFDCEESLCERAPSGFCYRTV